MARHLELAAAVLLGVCLLGVTVGAQDAGDNRLSHLLINEIEINPPGLDTDNEWVELLNPTDEPIDLAGWQISYSYRETGFLLLTETSQIIAPGGRFVFVYPGLRLRNGEPHIFRLLNPDGEVVEETAPFKDESDNERTWQRFPDGGADPWFPDLWLFMENSRNKPNG